MGAEVPFVLSVAGTLVRGSIDLLVERPDGSVLVVDYKTDRLGDRDPEEVVSRYSVQRDLYALAAAARGERRWRPPTSSSSGPTHRSGRASEAPSSRPLEAGSRRLLERLAAGRFEVTEHPHRELCLDCPARERLCSHDTAAQMREDPDPAIRRPSRRAEPQLSLLEGE